jgi:hypothetical protein
MLMRRVLRPVASLLMRNGIAFADFADVARKVFVEVAEDEFAIPGRKQSVSRVSVLTGINRKEVKRLLAEREAPDAERIDQATTASSNNRAARVISAWLREPDYQDDKGNPALLSWGKNESNGFESLVKHHSGDIPARAILDELKRVGAVSMPDESTVKLLAHGYVPSASNDELLKISAQSAGDLLDTIEHNLAANEPLSRLQLSVAYDDLPAQSVELFRQLSTEKGRELLVYLDQFLATQDRGSNPSVKGSGRYRAGLGVYYFEEDLGEDHADGN